MRLNNLRVNLIFFFITYFFLVSLISFMSYKFFIADFVSLENRVNKNNIITLLKIIDKRLINLKNITSDYSNWDDTYNFIENKNNKYIEENFRAGTNTLEDLDIDALIISNNNDDIKFSIYNENIEGFKSKKMFEQYLIDNLSKVQSLNSILEYKSHLFYIVKVPVKKSDKTGQSNGYMISMKLLTNKQLKNESDTLFKTVSIENNDIKKEKYFEISLKYLEKSRVYFEYVSEQIVSYIVLNSFDGKYLGVIKTSNDDLIVRRGEKTIIAFNLMGALILFFVFVVIYQNQRLIIDQNRILNKKVLKRTVQLNKAYKNLKGKNRELYRLANMDYLTQINNRSSFFVKSIELLKESNKHYSEFAILIIDIDYFKQINDRFGHSAGDKVLIKFSEMISTLIEKDMVFARVGGEEFCIAILDKKIDFVEEFAQKVRKLCLSITIPFDNENIKFTVSIGGAYKNNQNESIDEIIHNADMQLYKAKNEGRNRVFIVS